MSTAPKNESGNMNEDKKFSSTLEFATEHVHQKFLYSSNQRLVTFRFYLIVTAVFVSAYVAVYVAEDLNEREIAMTVVACLGFLSSLCFYHIEKRNLVLIEFAGKALIKLQEKLSESIEIDEVKLYQQADNQKPFLSQILRVTFRSIMFIWAIFAIIPWFREFLVNAFGVGP